MLNRLRTKAYGVLTSDRGGGNRLIRAVREAAQKANDAVGRPLAPADELAERVAYESRNSAGEDTTAAPEAAPVMVFFTEKHNTQVKRIRDIFVAADVPFTEHNIEGDLPTIEATLRDGNGFQLPLVFIAGECIGGWQQLLNLHNNDQLRSRVFGS